MASNEVRLPGGLSARRLAVIAGERDFWRWRYNILHTESPIRG